jgi:SAM-dependent methyltransferase
MAALPAAGFRGGRVRSEAHAPPGYEDDFRAYDTEDAVSRYRPASAGEGISYLLPTLYGSAFKDAARDARRETGAPALRLLEFGCGAGMASQYLVEALRHEGIDVDIAIGADFVPRMVEAATQELERSASHWARNRLRYLVARNEQLGPDLANCLGQRLEAIAGTFHLAVGVNTFRYSVRHDGARELVEQLELLLAPGGRVVAIDMNDRFPYGLKPRRGSAALPIRFGMPGRLPTLDEYARPFSNGAFDVLRKEHFAWIPHSANGLRFQLARAVAPILDRLIPDRAMRSLIVARRI